MSVFLLVGILVFVGFGVLLLAVVGGIVYVARRNMQVTDRAWRELGVKTGLAFKPTTLFSSPELNGEYRHRTIRLYTYSDGPQGQRSVYTAVRLAVNNATDAILDIAPAGLLGNFLVKAFNTQDVEIGNPTFDEHFVVRSNPAEAAAKVLANSSLPMAMMEVPHGFRIQLEGSVLAYTSQNVQLNVELLTRVFNTLSDLADGYEALR